MWVWVWECGCCCFCLSRSRLPRYSLTFFPLSSSPLFTSARGDTLDDGDKFRQELLREETKLKVIRDQMVTDLKTRGVNPRYLSEMINVDVGKMLRR